MIKNYQVLYNKYNGIRRTASQKTGQEFLKIEARNKNEAEILARRQLRDMFSITPTKTINIMKLSK